MERYFRIDRHAGVKLICLDPVLSPDDIALIIEDEPTDITAENHTEHWQYDFQKRYIRGQEEQQNFDFAQILEFNQEKLASIHYTSTFLSVFEPSLLRNILQAIGRGTLDEEDERVVFQWDGREALPPTQQQIEAAWGAPYSIIPIESRQYHIYIYTLRSPQIPKEEPVPVLHIWLTFRSENHKLAHLKGWYKSTSLEIDFAEDIRGFLDINL